MKSFLFGTSSAQVFYDLPYILRELKSSRLVMICGLFRRFTSALVAVVIRVNFVPVSNPAVSSFATVHVSSIYPFD